MTMPITQFVVLILSVSPIDLEFTKNTNLWSPTLKVVGVYNRM